MVLSYDLCRVSPEALCNDSISNIYLTCIKP